MNVPVLGDFSIDEVFELFVQPGHEVGPRRDAVRVKSLLRRKFLALFKRFLEGWKRGKGRDSQRVAK